MSCLGGTTFIWNDRASEQFGIEIVSINNISWQHPSGSGVTFTTEEISRNPELLFLNASQFPVLTFPIEFICDEVMDIHKFMAVKDCLSL